ncbi:hypothetical protein ACWC5I_18970 [Kitasatospora sp. NPDC001574]
MSYGPPLLRRLALKAPSPSLYSKVAVSRLSPPATVRLPIWELPSPEPENSRSTAPFLSVSVTFWVKRELVLALTPAVVPAGRKISALLPLVRTYALSDTETPWVGRWTGCATRRAGDGVP